MTNFDPVLYGAKTVLRYLREAHGIQICRDTLWRMARRNDERQFPIRARVISRRLQVTADRPAIDKWVKKYASPRVVEQEAPTTNDAV